MNNSSGETLAAACREGDLKKVQDLMKQGVDVNYKTKQFKTPIYEALDNGHEEIVAELLKQDKLDVNLGWTIKLQTPLHFCCENGKSKFVKMLLAHPKINKTLKNKDGKTPAELTKSNAILKLLA